MATTGDVAVDVAPQESSTALVGSDSAPPRKTVVNTGAPAWAFIVTGVMVIVTAIMIVLLLVELDSRDRKIFDGECSTFARVHKPPQAITAPQKSS